MAKLIALLAFVACCSQALAFGMPHKLVDADNDCCMCGPEITVTLLAQNTLMEPFFNISVRLTTHQRELIYIMKEAVDFDKGFQFTVSYTGKEQGYYLESVNKVAIDSTRQTYWGIQTADGYTSGISSFVPNDGDVVWISLQQSSG